MDDTYGGYLDPGSGRLIVFATPASHPELWRHYIDGALAAYRQHGVENALDYARIRDGAGTTLFVAALEFDGMIVGGLRVQGPYVDVDQACAVDEWNGRAGTKELRRQIGGRLGDGVIEIKGAWVDRFAGRHHEITDAISRAFIHSMELLDVRYAMCTAASHAIRRWQTTGGVVSTDVPAVPYPDDRYRTRLMWWDRESLFESIAAVQIPALAWESSQLASWLPTTTEAPAIAIAR